MARGNSGEYAALIKSWLVNIMYGKEGMCILSSDLSYKKCSPSFSFKEEAHFIPSQMLLWKFFSKAKLTGTSYRPPLGSCGRRERRLDHSPVIIQRSVWRSGGSMGVKIR